MQTVPRASHAVSTPMIIAQGVIDFSSAHFSAFSCIASSVSKSILIVGLSVSMIFVSYKDYCKDCQRQSAEERPADKGKDKLKHTFLLYGTVRGCRL